MGVSVYVGKITFPYIGPLVNTATALALCGFILFVDVFSPNKLLVWEIIIQFSIFCIRALSTGPHVHYAIQLYLHW